MKYKCLNLFSQGFIVLIKKYLVFIFVTSIAATAMSQRNYHGINSLVTIDGTSNLHDWKSAANEARVEMVMTIDTGGLKAIHYLMVDVPVKAIKSSKGVVMDNNTYLALKAVDHPSIIYKLEKVNKIEKRGDIYIISTIGSLTVAGVNKKIELTVVGYINQDGNVYFKFSKKIKMTDYNIKLPSILFGLIKTGNEIELKFNLVVKQS